jgi:hypothetical protein
VIRGEGLALIAAVKDRELFQRRHPPGFLFVGAVAAHVPQTLMIVVWFVGQQLEKAKAKAKATNSD